MDFTETRFNRNKIIIANLQLAINIIITDCKAIYAIQVLTEEQEILFEEGQENIKRKENIERHQYMFTDINSIKKAREDLRLALECILSYSNKARSLSPARRILMKEDERLEKEEILNRVDNKDGSNIENKQCINDRLLDEIIRVSKKNGQLENRIEYLEDMLRAINNDENRKDIFKRRV